MAHRQAAVEKVRQLLEQNRRLTLDRISEAEAKRQQAALVQQHVGFVAGLVAMAHGDQMPLEDWALQILTDSLEWGHQKMKELRIGIGKTPSPKQLVTILELSQAVNMSRDQLNDHCREEFGEDDFHLLLPECAERLIEQLSQRLSSQATNKIEG